MDTEARKNTKSNREKERNDGSHTPRDQSPYHTCQGPRPPPRPKVTTVAFPSLDNRSECASIHVHVVDLCCTDALSPIRAISSSSSNTETGSRPSAPKNYPAAELRFELKPSFSRATPISAASTSSLSSCADHTWTLASPMSRRAGP